MAGDEHELLVAESHLPSVALIHIDAAKELSSLGVQRAHAFRDLQRIADHLVVFAVDYIVNGVSGDQQVLLVNRKCGKKAVSIFGILERFQCEIALK